MGQKVHPYGFRLGFNKTWRSRWFADKDYAKLLHEDIRLRADLKKRFAHAGVAKIGSIVFAARCLVTVFRDSPVRREISRIDNFCRKCIRRMMFKSPMWITPLPPPLNASGEGSHGSVLSEN